ncbi:MAG: flippase [Burkholderiales bacterium]
MILRNAFWNLLGLGLPLLVAVVCIPPLIASLGASRFGVLTLVWAVVSYFGVFDLGLGRALTQQVSAAIGAGRADEMCEIAAAGLWVMVALGAIAGAALWFAAPAGVALLKSDADPHEAIDAARALAWAMPFVVLASGLRGVMEAHSAFVPINVVRLATGVLTFAVPLAAVRSGWNDLAAIAWMLACVRAVGCALYAGFVARLLPGALAPVRPDGARIRELATQGGWMTVTNVVGPLMGYLDRFVIGAVLSLSAVAWYVTPQEIVSRLLIVPGALTSVLFPRLSEIHASGASAQEGRRIERLALGALFLALFPATLLLGLLAYPVLDLWIGPVFAREGATAMLVLCAGVLFNSLAQVPFAAIQARGGARTTALLHLAELPLFVVAVWLFTARWGVAGAALAWTLRMGLDLGALLLIARWHAGGSARLADRISALRIGLPAIGAFVVAATASADARWVGALALGATAWAVAAWHLRGDAVLMLGRLRSRV